MSAQSTDSELLLLHNPRCSKSRAALALLESRGADFRLREYLADPLSPAELSELKGALGRPVTEWVRKQEQAFEDSGLSADSSEAELIDAIADQPILLERPILIRGEKAVIGRPTEDLEALL
jgi:arsenate reductase